MELSDTDLLRFAVSDLQKLLKDGKLTSEQLVTRIFKLISSDQNISLKINPIISLAPLEKVLKRARKLDEERKKGKVRSELHGIPLLVKDAFITHEDLGMRTTVGNLALADAQVFKNAEIVQRLIDMGMIIIAKTNMNEFCNMKGNITCNGWSAVGGQTLSAYVADGLVDDGIMGNSNPCGSSTGSAVGVSAGYAPLALGTETEGSLVSPAGRAALYSIKCTPGTTPMTGVYLISKHTDSIGFFAKTVADLALATEVATGQKYNQSTVSDAPLSVNYLDPSIWKFSPRLQAPNQAVTQEQVLAFNQALDLLRKYIPVNPATLTHPADRIDDTTIFEQLDVIFVAEYAQNIKNFLANYDSSPVRTVQDIINFNEKHSDRELPSKYPNQYWLTWSLKPPPTLQRALDIGYSIVIPNGVTITLLDSDLHSVAAATNCPIATVPLGISNFNGRPYGLAILAQPHREDLLFAFMYVFEAIFPARALPEALIEARKASIML